MPADPGALMRLHEAVRRRYKRALGDRLDPLWEKARRDPAAALLSDAGALLHAAAAEALPAGTPFHISTAPNLSAVLVIRERERA